MINVGIIGGGFGCYGIAEAFKKSNRYNITALATRNIEHARKIAIGLGDNVQALNVDALIQNRSVEVVAVAVPPAQQLEIIGDALLAGKSIFAEKPLGISYHEAEEVAEIAKQLGRPNIVDFIFPELETWRKAKDIIDSGVVGQINQIFLDWRMESYDIENHI